MRTFHTVPFQWPKAALAELDKSSERIRTVARFKDLFRDLNLRIVTSQSQLEGKKEGGVSQAYWFHESKVRHQKDQANKSRVEDRPTTMLCVCICV